MEVGEARIFGLEAYGLLLVEPGAEQVQAIASEGDVVRGKREEQALRWCGGTGGRVRIKDEVEKLGKGKAELAAVIGDEVEESGAAVGSDRGGLGRCFG